MERHFRKYTFLVDWCYFRLLTRGSIEQEQGKKATKDHSGHAKSNDSNSKDDMDGFKLKLPSEPEIFQFRSEIPERGYGLETLIATVIPGITALLLRS